MKGWEKRGREKGETRGLGRAEKETGQERGAEGE